MVLFYVMMFKGANKYMDFDYKYIELETHV